MQLSFDQLKACSFGVQCLTQEDGAVRFRRFPPALEAHYQRSEGAQIRCGCPAGVHVRFRSDTDALRLALRYGRQARALYRGVLVVDGGEEHAWGPEAQQTDWRGEIFSGAGRREREFELWLPHLCEVQLVALELTGGASFSLAPRSSRRWLALGDSITQGMTSTLPTRCHVARVARSLNLAVRNFGVGGERLVPVLADGLPPWPFAVATVAYGTNDLASGVPLERWRANAVRLAQALNAVAPSAPLLFLTPIPWVGRTTPNAAGLYLQDYREALAAAVCGLRNVQVLDGAALIDERADLFVDGVHPNDAGFAMYAERLGAAMRPLVQSVS